MLNILLKSRNKIICEAESIQVEQVANNKHVVLVRLMKHTHNHTINEYIGTKLIIDVFYNTYKYGMVVLNKGIIFPDAVTEKDDCLEIIGEFGFSNNYNPYNQELINHVHKYWTGNFNTLIDRSTFDDKDFCLYLETLAIYRNFPKQLQLKSKYLLETKTIRNKCDLFIQLGEMFAGKQTYFCYGLDVLDKSLCYHFKSIDSKIPFEIRDKDLIVQKVGEKYFKTLLDVLDPFFIIEMD